MPGMTRLQWLHWQDDEWDSSGLPVGPYAISLQHLVTSFGTASTTLPALAGMGQLQRLSLTNTPKLETGGQFETPNVAEWHAFWAWAERHPPLRRLDFLDSGLDYDGVVPTLVRWLPICLLVCALAPALTPT